MDLPISVTLKYLYFADGENLAATSNLDGDESAGHFSIAAEDCRSAFFAGNAFETIRLYFDRRKSKPSFQV